MIYGKRYCLEISIGSNTNRIFADTIAEIDEKNKWKNRDSLLMEAVPAGNVNTWTAYTVLGTERVGSMGNSEVDYIEESVDGHIQKVLERIMQRCYVFTVFKHVKNTMEVDDE